MAERAVVVRKTRVRFSPFALERSEEGDMPNLIGAFTLKNEVKK